MTEYMNFIGAVLLTALVVAIVGALAAGGYLLYKTIKDE